MDYESLIISLRAEIASIKASVEAITAESDEEFFDEFERQLGDGGGGGVWSGYYWFGGEVGGAFGLSNAGLEGPPITKIDGRYFGINLRLGTTEWSDNPSADEYDVDQWEWRRVADKVIVNEGEPDEVVQYTLSNRTCGDIVFRVV
jgi:hypothetical protein